MYKRQGEYLRLASVALADVLVAGGHAVVALSLIHISLKFYLPVAWKLSKRYFIVSVIHVIVQAVLPFIDLIFLPLLVDALCQPQRSVIQIILYAALMVGLDIAVGTAGSQLRCV